MIRKILFLSFSTILLFSAYKLNNYNKDKHEILDLYKIEKLKNEVYYFPAKKNSNSRIKYQPLKRFDLIFVGHKIDLNSTKYDKFQNLAALIPGKYTHVLSYIGKDKHGFAYAIEMNANENQIATINFSSLNIEGKLYIYCLGRDFNNNSCPDDKYIYGIKSYDYMWAKRLKPKLRQQLMVYEDKIMNTIKNDLINSFPFQIPLDINTKTLSNKIIPLVDDGRENGADCVSYFISLFEEIANTCIVDTKIDAKALEQYYLNDIVGKKAVIPKRYNLIIEKTLKLNETIGILGYSLVNNIPRKSLCRDKIDTYGVSTPNLLFNSASMINIK